MVHVVHSLYFCNHQACGFWRYGKIVHLRIFEGRGNLDLADFGDTRYSRNLIERKEVLYSLLDNLKKQSVRGKLPQRTLVLGYTFTPSGSDPKYDAAVKEFRDMYNIASAITPELSSGVRGYVDWRDIATDKLAAKCQELGANASKIAVVSLGDEIGLAAPPATDQEGFRTWAKAQGLKPGDIDPAAGDDWTKIVYNTDRTKAVPGVFYFSQRYAYYYGIQEIKKRTDILRQGLPNAGIGANFSPHGGYHYLGHVYQWVTLFREQGMTLPWSEDYIWQIPVGTPEMNFICLDLFRAGLRGQKNA